MSTKTSSHLSVFFFFFFVVIAAAFLVPGALSLGDRLDVTWGHFDGLPLSVNDAVQGGWGPIESSCGTFGTRYQLNGDRALSLLMDSAGNLGGVQVAILNQPPSALQPPFEDQGDGSYTMTLFFQDPAGICSQTELVHAQTIMDLADRLTLRNGNTGEYLDQPLTEDQVDTSYWVKSPCFVSMGTHYWGNITANMDCSTFYPLGIMYQGGNLVTFLVASVSAETSSRWEHPRGAALNIFFNSDTNPQCLYADGVEISTMHFFMTNPIYNTCL